jgi:hypothetical protein
VSYSVSAIEPFLRLNRQSVSAALREPPHGASVPSDKGRTKDFSGRHSLRTKASDYVPKLPSIQRSPTYLDTSARMSGHNTDFVGALAFEFGA